MYITLPQTNDMAIYVNFKGNHGDEDLSNKGKIIDSLHIMYLYRTRENPTQG